MKTMDFIQNNTGLWFRALNFHTQSRFNERRSEPRTTNRTNFDEVSGDVHSAVRDEPLGVGDVFFPHKKMYRPVTTMSGTHTPDRSSSPPEISKMKSTQ